MAYSSDSIGAVFGMMFGLFGIMNLFTGLLSIASYVLTALALYTIAQRRGIHKPWLAWIPVANCWLLGSISDQYQYVVKGENKSKRKFLLGLGITEVVLGITMTVMAVAMIVKTAIGISGYFSEEAFAGTLLGPVMTILGLCVPLLGVSIAYAIIRYMALYDIYKSLDPSNSVMFLVLSILFGVTEPFFLFFNRNKDLGMPPRRQSPPYAAVQAPQEPWEDENKDYL